MDHIYVIKKPLVTEKSTAGMEANKYAFEVASTATKPQIKAAVESLYKVRVEAVNTQVRRDRDRRLRYGLVRGKEWKMAVVRLHKDDKIDLLS
ncbi:MAG: 50S ribosomal protein L23 [Phycisphaerales bacterium]